MESDDATWPANASRNLQLEITPDRVGKFKVYFRFWLCSDGYADCRRAPTSSKIQAYDQQYWGVREVTINVVRPIEPPEVNSLGCSSLDVEVNKTVTCSPRLGGDDATEYSWSSVGGSRRKGTNRNFSTSWDTPGQKLIAFGACNEGGCDVGEHYVTVRAIEPPRVVDLNCSAVRARLNETVSCRPRLGGGDSTGYLWGSIGGAPWSGTARNYSTGWDTPGRKRIVFEACNAGGCDSGEEYIDVVGEPPVIDSLGCSPVEISVGEQLSCRPGLSGGDPTAYTWGAIGGAPWSGHQTDFSTYWDSPGNKKVVLEVCNTAGCDVAEQYIPVLTPQQPPIVDSLGCFPAEVLAGESVHCYPKTNGGDPTAYTWGAIGGAPWSGHQTDFSTYWDSPGNKKVVLEVCNTAGCDVAEQYIPVLDAQQSPTIHITADGSIYPGSDIAISGSNFPQYMSVDGITIGQERSSFAFTNTDRYGEFTIYVTVPRLAPSLYTVVVNAGGLRATTTINVEEPPYVPGPETRHNPQIHITTDGAVFPGSTIQIIGTNFPKYVVIDEVTMGQGYAITTNANTDRDGDFSFPAIVPPLESGVYQVKVDAGGSSAVTSISVEELPYVPGPKTGQNPAIHITADGVVFPGSTIQIIGTNFPKYVLIDEVTIGQRYAIATDVNADREGGFTIPVLVPRLESGVYLVRVNTGGSSAVTSITVAERIAPNRPPETTAVAPPVIAQAVPGDRLLFTADATDADGNIVRVTWSVDGRAERHGFVAQSGYAIKSFSRTFHETGVYRVMATFKDSWGEARSVAWEVEVIDSVVVPLSMQSIGCPRRPVAVHETLSCQPDISGGAAVEFRWLAENGTPGHGQNREFTTAWNQPGNRRIELEICDRTGCLSAQQTITVRDAAGQNDVPLIEIVEPPPAVSTHVGTRREFTVDVNSPGGDSVWVTWLVDSAALVFEEPFAGRARKTFTHSFDRTGQYTVRAFAYDANGNASEVRWLLDAEKAHHELDAYDSFSGTLDAETPEKRFKILVKEGRRLWVSLRGSGDDRFRLDIRRLDSSNDRRDWPGTGYHVYQSRGMRGVEPGWYEIRVSSRGGGGRYSLKTLVGGVRLELTFSSPVVSDIEVSAFKRCKIGVTYTSEPLHPPRFPNAQPGDEVAVFDLTNFADDAKCILYDAEGTSWEIKVFGAEGMRIENAQLHLMNNFEEWTLTAFQSQLPDGPISNEEVIWIPSEPTSDHVVWTQYRAARAFLNFMFLDNARTLTDEEAAGTERLISGGLLVMDVGLPGSGKLASTGGKFAIKFLLKGGKHAETWLSTSTTIGLRKLDESIGGLLDSKKGSLKLGSAIADEANVFLRQPLREAYGMGDEAIDAIASRLKDGGYSLSKFAIAMDDISEAHKVGRLDSEGYGRLLGQVRGIQADAGVGILSNVLQVGSAAQKGYPIATEVAVAGGKSVDLAIFPKGTSKRGLKDALVIQEIKQRTEPWTLSGFRSQINGAKAQLSAVQNIGEHTRRQVLIDARFIDDLGTKNTDDVGKLLGTDYWENINGFQMGRVVVDDIIILTRDEPIIFTRPGLTTSPVIY